LNCFTISKNFEIKDDTASKDKLKKQLTDSMYKCSSMWFQGKSELAGIKFEKLCAICYLYNITPEKDKHPIITDFEKYLRDTTIPKEGGTYKEYLGPFWYNSDKPIVYMRSKALDVDYGNLDFNKQDYWAVVFFYYYDGYNKYGGVTRLMRLDDTKALGCEEFLAKV
jgi:hypothetical protein